MAKPTSDEIEAAAQVLDKVGRFHRWWPEKTPDYRNLDPIGKSEFEAIAEQMLMAADRARSGSVEEETPAGDYLPPGTRVRYAGIAEGGPEYGVVVHCWMNDEIGGYDCYVAFFGSAMPTGDPGQMPYVLRYASTSLAVIE